MYEYRAEIIKVVDGDTVDVDLDLGLDVHINVRLRLVGINTPEHGTAAGDAATKYARYLMPLGSVILVQTRKDQTEKYGRYLAVVTNAKGWVVNERMIAKGHAVSYDGGKR